MLRAVWRGVRNAAIIVGVALSFFAVIELIRAFETLQAVHPVLGYGFLALLGLGLLYLVARCAMVMGRTPAALIAPAIGDPATADAPALRRYACYVRALLRRLSQNPGLSEQARQEAAEELTRLRAALAERPDAGALRAALQQAESLTIRPAMDDLDRRAEREVRTCVRDVMLGVTLSPWRSADLLVVVYRNTAMVLRIIRTYNSRPALKEQFLIVRDVLAIVATVNFLNFGSRLLQNLTASVPFLGRLSDDIAQGVGAGLLTSVAGHAAVDRCCSYRGWDRATAQETMRRKLAGFFRDVRDIVIRDIVPDLRRPIEAQVPEQGRKPELLSRAGDGIQKALDETADVMDLFIGKPVVAAGRGVATGGMVLGQAAHRSGRWVGRRFVSSLQAAANAPASAWRRMTAAARRTGKKPPRRPDDPEPETGDQGPGERPPRTQHRPPK